MGYETVYVGRQSDASIGYSKYKHIMRLKLVRQFRIDKQNF